MFSFGGIVGSLAFPFWLSLTMTNTTANIGQINQIAYSSEWIKYPAGVRKYTVMMMARSQKNIYFTGLKLVYCTLEEFMKVFIIIITFFLKSFVDY